MARKPAAASPPQPRGALTLLNGPGACVGAPCPRLRGATALLRMAVSPDGRNLYLSGQAGGLSILARERRTVACASSPAGQAVFAARAASCPAVPGSGPSPIRAA